MRWQHSCSLKRPEGFKMKYGIAYLLGVPGVLILAWFVFNHMH